MYKMILAVLVLAAAVYWWWPAPAQQNAAVTVPQQDSHVSNGATTVATPVTEPLQQLTALILSPPYSQPVTAANLAQTQAATVAAVTVPQDDGSSWQLALSRYRFSFPEPVQARLQIEGTAPALLRYQLRGLDQQLYASGVVAADPTGQYVLEIPGQADFPAELELSVESEPGLGALARLSYSQPVAWLAETGALEADDTDLLIPLQLQVEKAGLYRVQAVLAMEQPSARPLAILQGEFQLEAGRQPVTLRAHYSVLPEQPFDALLSQLQLELAPPRPGDSTGYGRPLASAVALGDFNPQALSRTPYEPDAHAQQSVLLLQQLSR
jgi:hypothetical protein